MSQMLNIGRGYYAACVDSLCEKVRRDPNVLEGPRNQLVERMRWDCGDLAAAQYKGAVQALLGYNKQPGVPEPLNVSTKTIEKMCRLLELAIARALGIELGMEDQTWLIRHYPKRHRDRQHFDRHVNKCIHAVRLPQNHFNYAKFRAKIQKTLTLEWGGLPASMVPHHSMEKPFFEFFLLTQVLISPFRHAV